MRALLWYIIYWNLILHFVYLMETAVTYVSECLSSMIRIMQCIILLYKRWKKTRRTESWARWMGVIIRRNKGKKRKRRKKTLP